MSHHFIDVQITRIASALHQLVAQLRALGYEFAHPAAVLPGPETTVQASIRRIESEIGTVPYALAEFWRQVGSVDLRGTHPAWRGCDYPDPLMIDSASSAVTELDEFLADRDERMRYDFPYVIPIAPDDYHKAEASGGMWYNVSCPGTSDDPPINDERHHVTFLNYLELALRRGGFLGLDRSPGHNWPLQALSINITPHA